jgi:DNA helicase IV
VLPEQRRDDPELAAEQGYVDAAYARLESMRAAAERVRAAYSDVRAGGTHQARLERDIAWDVTQRRLADLDIGDSPLVFGRLDMEDASRWYIGRLAVEDESHTPLVIDWRAPVAEPFYRATAVAPMAVVRRRHLITKKGREVTALDDEVFDQRAIADAGLEVAGEGALLAALERDRTGRMGDIVATIQAEQDQAIRAEIAGILVVAGGPGTGKTAVALHRAAYLLYTHRRRLASSGVLLVGPSPVFLRYIEQVLPSLGEQDVQLSTLTGLKPRLHVTALERRDVATLKGDGRMARVIERAVSDRERPLARELVLVMDGLRLRITRGDTARIVEGTRKRRGTHNEKRQLVVRRLVDMLVARYKEALVRNFRSRQIDAPRLTERAGLENGANVTSIFDRDSTADPTVAGALARGEAPPEGWESELRGRIRNRPEVREALERCWPVISGAELVNDLFGFRALIRSAARDILSEADMARLHRRRDPDVQQAAWSEADIALIDEADALVGPVEAARPRRRRRRSSEDALDTANRVIEDLGLHGFTDAASLANRYGDGNNDATESIGEPRTYGHILVDEAQDLTAMQWRMLARRCPSGSMTLVGDPGQASRPGAVASWDDVLGHLPTHIAPQFVTLSVNYRTPTEVMDVAARLLAVAAPTVEPSRSVRSTGEQPRFIATTPGDLVARTAETVRAVRARSGTLAVIAPTELHMTLAAELHDIGAVANAAEALDAQVAILDATDAKGLEFDHVVVVEPSRLVTSDAAGLRLLYVTITRTTKSLVIVHSGSLPEGLAPERVNA